MLNQRDEEMKIFVKQKAYESYIGQIRSLHRKITPSITIFIFLNQGYDLSATESILILSWLNRVFDALGFLPWFANFIMDISSWLDDVEELMAAPDMQKDIYGKIESQDQ